MAAIARPSLWRNPLSLLGGWLTTLSAFAFIVYFVIESLGLLDNPYSGLFGFIAIPAVFVAGLLMIPIGVWREARRRKRGSAPWSWPTINLANSRTQQVLIGVLVLTVVNLAIVGVAGFGASHYMETDQFCGQVCHEPMKPEFTAHRAPPHASVGCVRCHVGPGAAGIVRAKMNGARQAFLFMAGSYARPIPTPVHNLPFAADTCANCHTPGHPTRDVTRVIKEFADDETNTVTATTLEMLTGAIHWHARADVRVEFVATDAKRETIPYVKVTDAAGQTTEYFAGDATAPPAGAVRRMDCLDCHSRPAHVMSPSAAKSVDAAMAAGQISPALPFVKREAVAALDAPYPDEAAASAGIRKRLEDFYRGQPKAAPADVAKAIDTVDRLYQSNVFPAMKITWGTYQSQLGHTADVLGCFRCHDDEHKSRSGKVISQECERCHKGS